MKNCFGDQCKGCGEFFECEDHWGIPDQIEIPDGFMTAIGQNREELFA